MALINDHKRIKKTHAIVWDEVGIAYSARNFASQTNKLLNHVMESFRSRNLIIIMTVPSLDFIDLNARKLMHFYFETVKINRFDKQCIVKPLKVSFSPRYGKIYFKYPKIYNKKGKRITLNRVKFNLPNKEILKVYEVQKKNFVKELSREVFNKLTAAKEIKAKKKKIFNPQKYANEIKKLKWDKVSIAKVRAKFPELNLHRAATVRTLL